MDGCSPLILVDEILEMPVVNVVVLPIWCFVKLQIMRKLHAGIFLLSQEQANLRAVVSDVFLQTPVFQAM